MPQPRMREPAAPDESEAAQTDLFPYDSESGWQDSEPDGSLAYYDSDEQPEDDVDPAHLEATMMSNLEAVASAFWMETGPELAPLEDSDEPVDTEAWPIAAPPLDPESESWDFRDVGNNDLVGPRRGALLDFRPPRARRERPARPAKSNGRVKDHAQPRGAFADDLAARNKEFYDLLNAPAQPPRKITVAPPDAPPVRSGRRSFFAADREDDRDGYALEPAPRRRGFGRSAIALGIIVLVIGAGGVLIMTRTDAVVAPSGAAAAPAPETSANANAPSKDEGGLALSEAVPKVVKTERITVTEAAVPAAAPVDPGTLATPPLYEEPSAGAKSNPLASLDLRSTDNGATSSSIPDAAAVDGETVKSKATDSTAETASIAEDPIIDEKAPPAPAKAKAELDLKADKPPTKKVASADSRGNSPKSLRAATGSAIVITAVKMRSGPDNDAGVVKVVPTGARVDIVACKGWCEVIAGGDRGYIFQRFLNRAPAPQALAPAAKAEIVKASDTSDDRQPFDLLRLVRPAD